MTTRDSLPATGRLVFDGECGFCTRSAGWLRRLDRHGRIELQPYQRDGAPESVGVTAEQCREAVQWLGADGVRRSGADAVNAALSTALGTSLPARVYGATAGVQERVYTWVADHRSRLPGAVPHCEANPQDCSTAS